MSNLIPFNYNSKEVRTVIKDGEPWFVAADICSILDIDTSVSVNGRNRISDEGIVRDGGLDDDEKGTDNVSTPGGSQEMLVVSEPGLYSLIMKSRKTEAKQFKRWINHEVLPSIRKHGMYAKDELLDNPDLLIEVATKLKEERLLRLAAESKVQELTPAAEFGNAIKNNDGLILVRDYVKVLANAGIKIKQSELFKWLEPKYIYRNWHDDIIARKEYVEQGLFKVLETPVTTKTHGSFITFTTKITGKGQEYFLNKLKEDNPCQLQ